MGKDAFVNCNCLDEGKVKAPPFDRRWLEVRHGAYDLREDASDEIFYEYLKWKEDACEHKRFEICSERIGNIASMAWLKKIIKMVGEDKVRMIQSLFHKGVLEASNSKVALEEIQLIRTQINSILGIFLVENKTGDCYGETIEGMNQWFYSHGGEFSYGINEHGFYVKDQYNQVKFSSKRFSQKVIGKKVIFKDIKTGQKYKTIKAIERRDWNTKKLYYPEELNVIKRSLELEDVYSIVVLEKLFRASVKTGNPVIVD